MQLTTEHDLLLKLKPLLGRAVPAVQCLASELAALDAFLEGGLRYGQLMEWGMPLGRGGRDVVLRYLSRARHQWILWICGHDDVKIYPPAWMARGIDLSKIRFTYSRHPLRELKPLFLDPFFKVIVIDGVRHLDLDDCCFLSQRARLQQQSILVLRNYFLSPRRGNVWAKLRLNCWQDGQNIRLQVVRGLSPRELCLSSQNFEDPLCLL